MSSRLLTLLRVATTCALTVPGPPISQCIKLPPSLESGLAQKGIQLATPIQAAAFERALAGESLVLHAETGSGKSLAFLLPALARLGLAGVAEPPSADAEIAARKVLVLSLIHI